MYIYRLLMGSFSEDPLGMFQHVEICAKPLCMEYL